MDNQIYNQIVNFIWGIADDCLRDVYVRGKYRDVILPTQVKTHKDFILNKLYDIYTNYFNQAQFSSIKSEFRYALCWIDEALYME